MAISNNTDSLGITDKENLQIEALSLGASREDVASLSKQPVDEVPQQFETSEYDLADDQGPSDYSEISTGLHPRLASRKSVYGALAASQNIEQDVVTMQEDLTVNGESPTLDSLEEANKANELIGFQEVVRDAARQGDVEGTEALLEAAPTILDERTSTRVSGVENAAESFTDAHRTARRLRNQIKIFEEAQELAASKEAINRLIDREIAQSSDDFASFGVDMIDATFLGEQPLALRKVGRDILGENYVIAGGTMMKDLAQHLRALPVEKREAEAKKIIESFAKHSGVLTENDAVKVFALETFREFARTPGGDIPFDRWVTDVVGVFEVAGLPLVGTAVRGVAKTLKKIKAITSSTSSTAKVNNLSDLQRADPDLDGIMKAAALQDEKAAKAMGMEQSDVIAQAFPGNKIEGNILLEGAPKSLMNKMQRIATRAEEAEEVIPNTFLFHDADAIAKKKTVSDILLDEKDVIEARPSNSSVSVDAESQKINVTAVYGDDSDLPLTLAKADRVKARLTERFREQGILDPKVTVMAKDSVTDTYEVYNPKVHGSDSEVVLSVQASGKLGADDVVETADTSRPFKPLSSTIGTTAANVMIDHQGMIDSNVVGAARVALERKALKKTELNAIAKPFFKLGWSGKKQVAELLYKGERLSQVFPYEEMRASGYSDEVIEGYYSARFLNDTIYNIKNQDMREGLLKDGFKSLSVSLDSEGTRVWKNAGRVEENLDVIKSIGWLFDPISGKGIKVGDNIAKELQDTGMKVVKLLRRADAGDDLYSHAIVRVDDLHSLPKNVLSYRKGYNLRINKDPYFIDEKTTKRFNGESTTQKSTVGVARSPEEANRYIERLKRENPELEYESRLDRSLTAMDDALKADQDTLDNSGLDFWISERGDRLKRIDDSVSAVEDPISAINTLTSSVANVTSHRQFIEVSVARHKKKYGHLEVKERSLWSYDQDKRDWHFDKDLAKSSKDPLVTKALQEYEYLELMKYQPTDVDMAWKKTVANLNDMMGNFGQEKLLLGKARTALAKTLINNNPGQVARLMTFNMFLALRPFRQMPLQAINIMTMAGLDPSSMVKSIKDTNLMMLSLAAHNDPSSWKFVKESSRLLGYQPEEWEGLFEAFRKSGKAYAIDSHVAVGEANLGWSRSMPETLLGEVGRQAGNVARSPFVFGKAIGFNMGELANQTSTWLFAMRRWKKANPGKDPLKSQRALDEIASTARNLSVDMTRTSSFAYQRGAFATATQFLAINHKMFLRIWAGQDPDFKGLTRAKYTAGMLAMFGAAGVGLQDFYDDWSKSLGVALPPGVDDALYGGFIQAMFNKSLDLAFEGEGSRTAFSDSFSPASGSLTFAHEFFSNALEGNFAEALAGASGSVVPKIGDALNMIDITWGRDDLDTPEKVIASFERGAQQFGHFSDYFKFNMMAAYSEKMDELKLVDGKGRPTMAANTWGEVFAKAALGVNTRGEQEFYNKWLEMYRESNSTGKKRQATIDKDVDRLVNYMFEEYAKADSFKEFAAKMNSISFAFNRGDKSYGRRLLAEARKKFVLDRRSDKFISDIAATTAAFDADTNFQEMRNAVTNSDVIPENSKPIVIKNIDALELSSENTRRLINEN